jgi:hypothetical protein
VSVKTHQGAGTFSINLPLDGSPGIEPRTGGSTNDHTVVVTFGGPVTVTGSPQAQVFGIGCVGSGGTCSPNGAVSVSGNTVTIPLTNVADAQVITIRLNGVSAPGAPNADVFIQMGILLADTNGDGSVNSGDTLQTRTRSGQTVDSSNFRSDVNRDGVINIGDVIVTRSRSGNSLP